MRNFDFVKAARALGQSDRRIIWRHVLPNAMVSTLTFLPFVLTGSVAVLTSLDSSALVCRHQGKRNLQAPWLGFTAFFALAVMLSLLVSIGEAVREAFDPRKTYAGEQSIWAC